MTKREIESLLAYLIRRHDLLESEMIQLQTNVRYRRVDVVDCLELSLAIERYNSFNDFAADVRQILNLQKCDFEEEKL